MDQDGVVRMSRLSHLESSKLESIPLIVNDIRVIIQDNY